jgi:hypothetical protein
LVLDNGRFDNVQPFTGSVAINTTDADGKPSVGTWNAMNSQPFALANLPAKDVAWILVTPDNGAALDALPTFEPVATSPVNAMGQVTADLALVRDSNIETIFDTLSLPVQRDTSAAQVVLRITRKGSTAGVPGVTVRAVAAAAVVYGANSGYSDVATTTDATGVVVLLNVPAAKYPGALVSVQMSGALSGGAQVRAVSGAATLATVGF